MGKRHAKQPVMRAVTRALRIRIGVVCAGFALVCFTVLPARLVQLQIVDGEEYARRAAGQQLRDTVIPAARGDILSADGTPLACTETCWTVRASPRELDDALVEPAARAMEQLLGADYASTLQKLSRRTDNDCLIRRRITRAQADALLEWCSEHGAEGILVLEDVKRVYPEGNFGGSILGFVNVDGDGVCGLELAYNTVLKGRDGRVLTAKNAWGYNMPVHYETAVQAQQGHTLTLTVDAYIQHILENHLLAAVKEHHVGSRAVGIVMEPATGKILAMSTKPDYDPNEPRRIENEALRTQIDALQGAARKAALQQAQQAQWRNKAVSDLYEPGSVFKLITASAALDSGVCTPESRFVCAGKIRVAGTTFRCANGHIHGNESFRQGLSVSCNPCFIQIGAKLGKQAFCEYFERFGLGSATGVDLPAEPVKSEYYTAERMGPVELASCSFGQSSKITYLQMLTAVCAAVTFTAGSAWVRLLSGRTYWTYEQKFCIIYKIWNYKIRLFSFRKSPMVWERRFICPNSFR